MSLNDWLADGSIRRLRATRSEVETLMGVADRDLHDASVKGVSVDGRFSSAYSAALQLATIVLRAEGYRAASSGGGHHARTIALLPELMGERERKRARYLDACRKSRHRAEYDRVDVVSERDVVELLEDTLHFRNEVLAWLAENHPDLA